MRIAIILHEGQVSPVYELAQTVSLHDVEVREGARHDVGVHPFDLATSFGWMVEQGVRALLVGTIDPDNAEVLSKSGIHVFMGADDLSPAANVERFIALMRKALERRPPDAEA